jgi:hypothetical protein
LARRAHRLKITTTTYQAFDLLYNAPHTITCDPLLLGVNLTKAVLMAPGSLTHDSDMSQRYHELPITQKAPNRLAITMPPNDVTLPRGFYMWFVLTSQGVPAHALWVKLQ